MHPAKNLLLLAPSPSLKQSRHCNNFFFLINPTMNPIFPIKEEYPTGHSSSSGQRPDDRAHAAAEYRVAQSPRPMEGLQGMAPPPFLTKTFVMVNDLSTDHIVSWSPGGYSFVVWDPHHFSSSVLPKYFKHNNFSSFVRQLNIYGFRKIDPDRWEFANEAFLRGQEHLLGNIRRKKAISQPIIPSQQAVELGRFGLDSEIDQLSRDKQVLMIELVKLRQQQQNTRDYIKQMEQRLQGTERKQHQMMRFLAKAMKNPDFVQQLGQQKEIKEAMSKKRRRPIEAGETSRMNDVKPESLGFQVSELEALALEMQGFGKMKKDLEEEREETKDVGDKELDERFWQDILNEGFDEENGMAECGRESEEEDISVLADKLGFLGSIPK